MTSVPSSARLHVAALLLLVACTSFAWAQSRRCLGESRATRAAAPAVGAPAAAELLFGGSLDLNRAAVDDLAALPGIGPVRAARIVEERRARGGRFEAVDDLLHVPGIGAVTLARLRAHVRVGEAAAPR